MTFFFKLVQNPYITVRSDGSLHIERVHLQDGGEYTCVASNVAGTINKTTTVHVHGKRHTVIILSKPCLKLGAYL